MLLRTSSAPVGHSLFWSSPDRDVDTGITSSSKFTSSHEHSTKKVSFGHGLQHLCSVSCNSCSPTSLSPRGPPVGRKTIRRVQSDGNLEGLASPGSDFEGIYSSIMMMSKSLSDLQKALETEPSFSIYGKSIELEEVIDEEPVEGKEENEVKLERTATIGESIDAQFCFGWNSMQIINEGDNEEEELEEEEENEKSMNISKALGGSSTDHIDLGAASGGAVTETDVDFSSYRNCDLDKHYKKMLYEDPSNPLVLRNYGQYLESKLDFAGADEYYCRATLADPSDGEIMTQYAKLLWEVHDDQATASNYFKRAADVSPEDSNVLAAYANFLWNADEGEEEDDEELSSNAKVNNKPGIVDHSIRVVEDEVRRPSSPPLHLAMGLGIDYTCDGIGNKVDYLNLCSGETTDPIEEYYKRMIEENPYNPLFLGDYARFLHKSKGDLQGAEEYYSRAILEDPSDGQTLYLYAEVLWQLYHDTSRAGSYFERAIRATPNDCNVLAAYAKFLWDTEPEDDAIELAPPNFMPITIATAAITSA